MDSAQRTALRSHCRLAGETMQSRFAHPHGYYSVVLTVNSGYE
jgi:hypothetical protein